MTCKKDTYERTLRKSHSFRVLINGLESELQKHKLAAARAQRENRVLRALRRIHRLPAVEHGFGHFADAACAILMDEGAYRDARVSLRVQESSDPATGQAGCAGGFTETLYAGISHGGKRYGRLGVSILPCRDSREREAEIRFLSDVAAEIGLGFHRIDVRDGETPEWVKSLNISLAGGELSGLQC